jgi:uncharacterized membrane protein
MSEQEDQLAENGSANGGATDAVKSALTSKVLLIPAALSAAGALAATRRPDLLRRIRDVAASKGEDQARQFGEKATEGAKQGLAVGGLAGKALSRALPGGGGGSVKKKRRLPIERSTDVAVPVDKAYEAWENFDQYPKFMYRVRSVRQRGNDRVTWEEKIWFSKREWEGRITDRRKNDRIAWKTTSGMSHRGVVSFHKLDEHLTRVMVTMEFEPSGMMEKMASGLRFVNRAVEADLARYKACVEMEDAAGIEYRSASDTGDSQESAGRSDRGSSGDRDQDREEREKSRQERRERVGSSG